jgi:hypothetical protein
MGVSLITVALLILLTFATRNSPGSEFWTVGGHCYGLWKRPTE